MPHNQRKWRGGMTAAQVPRRISRFLEPCLLLLFHCKEGHGYELLEGLRPFGFGENPAELSTIYRVLRDLEERGLAVSQWDTTNAGPARRQYRITRAGEQYLQWWVDGLRETDRCLHAFLDAYDAHMEEHT